MARKDWFSQVDINGSSGNTGTSLTAEELEEKSYQYSLDKTINNKKEYYHIKGLIAKYEDDIASLEKKRNKTSSEEELLKHYKDQLKINKAKINNHSVVVQDPFKSSGTTSDGRSYSFTKGAGLANNKNYDKYSVAMYNDKYFQIPSDDMITLTEGKRKEAIEQTIAKGRPLTENELSDILGSVVNFENKLAWYSLMVDSNADVFGFAANGQVPLIDPETGQFQYDGNGILKTDPNATVIPGEINITSSDGRVITTYSDGSSVSTVKNEDGTYTTTRTDKDGKITTSEHEEDYDGSTTPKPTTPGNQGTGESIGTWNPETPTEPGQGNGGNNGGNNGGGDEGDDDEDDEPNPADPPKPEDPKDDEPTPPKVTIGENGNLFVNGVDTGYAVSQTTPSVADEVPTINDKGSGIDQFYRQNLDTLNVDPNSPYSNMYKQSMYGALNAQEQSMNATLAQAELDAYKMLGQQQLELENQIASQRMQAIKSGVTSAQLASQQLANIFAAQSGAAQVAQGVLDQRTSNYSNFAQQRTNVNSGLYDMLQQNQTTAANANTQMAAAQASYMSYLNQPYAQWQATANALKSLGDYGMYISTGGTPIEILNATKQQ